MKKPTDKQIKAVMRMFGALGGAKGGPARAAALSPERRREIASKAGIARGKQKTAEALARREQQEQKP